MPAGCSTIHVSRHGLVTVNNQFSAMENLIVGQVCVKSGGMLDKKCCICLFAFIKLFINLTTSQATHRRRKRWKKLHNEQSK